MVPSMGWKHPYPHGKFGMICIGMKQGASLGLEVQHRPVRAADRAAASRLHQVGHGEALHARSPSRGSSYESQDLAAPSQRLMALWDELTEAAPIKSVPQILDLVYSSLLLAIRGYCMRNCRMYAKCM